MTEGVLGDTRIRGFGSLPERSCQVPKTILVVASNAMDAIADIDDAAATCYPADEVRNVGGSRVHRIKHRASTLVDPRVISPVDGGAPITRLVTRLIVHADPTEAEQQELWSVVRRLGTAELEIRAASAEAAPAADRWVSTGDAAKMLSISSINTVKRWLSTHVLVGRKVGGRYQVSVASIERLLRKGSEELLALQTDHQRFSKLLEEDDVDLPYEPER